MTLLAILLPWLFGGLLTHRLLKYNEPIGLLSVGWAAGWLYALMGINFGLLSGLTLEIVIACALGGSVLGSALLAWACPGPPLVAPRLAWGTWAFLLVGSLAVYLTANSMLYLNPDDDYFLHAPLQGQLLLGTFPIINPFLPDVFYGGHYARDLLVVVMAKLSGLTLVEVQSPLTVALQVSTFLVLYTGLARATGSQLQGALGTGSVFVGANAGFRGGWLDTLANNNALAQSICALVFLLALQALYLRPSRSATLLTGLTLGGLAWAYETNFAVVSLGLCGLGLTTWALGCLRVSQLRTALLVVLIALPLATVQGGVFKHLFGKLVGGQELAATSADLTLQSQNLEVSAKFPKEALFKIKLDRSGEEMSMAYSTFPILRDLPKTGGTPGYVSVFSWHAIRIHWLALYLAPLSLVLLLRRRAWAGLLLWWVGCAGYFLPAVVDFGLWESEVFRWQFVAAWGFAGGLGIALADWWERLPGRLYTVSRSSLVLHRKALAALGLAVLFALNSYPCFHQVRQRTAALDSLANGFLFPSAGRWFERQPEVDLVPEDLNAGLWLAGQAREGERLLTNFRDENEFNIYFESSFLGLCGLRPVGHTFPLPFERLGTRPFRQSAATRAFWHSRDTALLGSLQPDWLYLRGREASDLAGLEGLELVYQASDQHSIFRVNVPKLAVGKPVPELRFGRLELAEPSAVEEYQKASLTLINQGSKGLEQTTTVSYELVDASGEPVEAWERFHQLVRLDVGPGGRQTVPMHFVAPHQQGEYRLVIRLGTELIPGEQRLSVGTRSLVAGLELVAAEPLDPLVAGQVARFRLRLRNPSRLDLRPQRVLAALRAKEPELPLHLVDDFSELLLKIAAHQEQEVLLPVEVPETMNGFELLLLPRDGWNVWELPARDP